MQDQVLLLSGQGVVIYLSLVLPHAEELLPIGGVDDKFADWKRTAPVREREPRLL